MQQIQNTMYNVTRNSHFCSLIFFHGLPVFVFCWWVCGCPLLYFCVFMTFCVMVILVALQLLPLKVWLTDSPSSFDM